MNLFPNKPRRGFIPLAGLLMLALLSSAVWAQMLGEIGDTFDSEGIEPLSISMGEQLQGVLELIVLDESLDEASSESADGDAMHVYTLEGLNPGDIIQVTMDSDDFDTYLYLLDADNQEVIVVNDDFEGSLSRSRITFEVIEDVRYQVVAASFANAGSGSYSLSITQGDVADDLSFFAPYSADFLELPDPLGTLEPGENASGNLAGMSMMGFSPSENVPLFYRIEGLQAGDEVTVRLESDDFDTYLYLIDATAGMFIDYNDDFSLDPMEFSTNSLISFVAEEGVDYWLLVSSFFESGAGTFDLIVEEGLTEPLAFDFDEPWDFSTPDLSWLDPVDITSISVSGSLVVPGELQGELVFADSEDITEPEGDIADFYQLDNIKAGDIVQITLDSDDFDTYLYLFNALTGEIIFHNDDFEGSYSRSRITFAAEPNTRYAIGATSYGQYGQGSYSLSITRSDDNPDDLSNYSYYGFSELSLPAQTPLLMIPSEAQGNIIAGERFDAFVEAVPQFFMLEGLEPNSGYTIRLESNEFDTYLYLLDADTGEYLDYNDDFEGTNSQLSFFAEEDRNYLVEVSSFGRYSAGNFTLSVSIGFPDAMGSLIYR